jgi:FkbM family methyltransferase
VSRTSRLSRPLLRVAASLPDPVALRISAALRRNGLAGFLLRPLARHLREGEVVVASGPGAGLRLVRGGSLRSMLGRSERRVQEVVARELRPGTVFFDVGANVGFYTLLGARYVGPAGLVVAFEPVTEFADNLDANIAANGFVNVRVHRVGIGARAGEAVVVRRTVSTGAQLTTSPGETGERVNVISLDQEIERGTIPLPDVIKIDVEGAEVDVVESLRNTLREHGPIVICEMHGKNREFAAALAALDYTAEVVEVDVSLEDAPWWVHVIARPQGSR